MAVGGVTALCHVWAELSMGVAPSDKRDHELVPLSDEMAIEAHDVERGVEAASGES